MLRRARVVDGNVHDGAVLLAHLVSSPRQDSLADLVSGEREKVAGKLNMESTNNAPRQD